MAERGTTSSEQPRPWQSYNTVYTNAKAGMDGIDKEKVQRIVYEMSKGSKYFENEERKEAETRQKIERMRAQCAKLSSVELLQYQMIADKRVLELEATRDLSKLWLHVDMDAFYAAVETLSDPSLKGKPMAVGSMSMISTANYEARRYGVRAAMPGFIARKLCPELIFVPTDFKKYTYYTELARKVFQKYDPKFFAASLDEAYLDITEVCKERGNSGAGIAEELRTAVFEVSGLTCSAGVAPNRLLAKVCSDINKPNGQYVLPNDRTAVMAFTSSLPIRKIGGIGKVTEHILRDVFGIKTCEDMLQKGGYCFALFSRGTADFFLSVGLGLGQTKAPQVSLRKSISNERTFSATDDEILLYKKLAELAELLSADMQKEGLHGRTLTLKLKTAAFEVRTRAITLQKYICSTEDILKYASNLLKSELPVSLRLIGLRASQFKEEKYGAPTDPTQKTLLNFVSGDASRKLQSSLCSDSSDHTVMNDTEADFSVDGQVLFQSEYRSHMDLYENDNTLDEATDDTSGQSSHQLDKAKISGADSSSPCCIEMDTPQKKKIDEGNYVIGRDEITSPSPSPSPSPSHLAEELTWINGYKCSVCGTELPPSFVEERKEHFDFHIAEKLQKEEESVGSRLLTPSPRLARKEPSATRRKSKKHKSSSSKGGSHVPIDLFFGKINK